MMEYLVPAALSLSLSLSAVSLFTNSDAQEKRKQASLERERAAAQKAEALGRWATLVTANLYRIPHGALSIEVGRKTE